MSKFRQNVRIYFKKFVKDFLRLFHPLFFSPPLQADANLHMQTKKFREETLEYVFLLQQVQERKKFDFVETVMTRFD